jgi:hypothetical protein
MGFASGFNVGWRSVNEAFDEREKRRLAEELRGLGPSAEAISGTGYEVISPEGQVTRGLAVPGTDLGAARQAYEQAGYQLREVEGPGMGQQFAARAGSRDVGMFPTQREAERASQQYDLGLTRQRADIYEGAGRFDEAERMRQLARTEGRAMGAEERAQAAETRAQGLYGFQEADLKRKTEVQGIQDRIAAMDVKDLDQLASGLNTNQSQVPMLFTGKNKDGYTFLTTDSKGQPQETLTYSASQVRRLAIANQLFSSGYAAEGLAELDKVDKSLADRIGARNAVTQAVATSAQGAERLGLTDRSLSARENETNLGRLTSYGGMLTRRLGELDKTINDPAALKRLPLDQQRALVQERNNLVGELDQIQTTVRSGLGLAERPNVPSAIDAAMNIARSGVNPQTNKPFTDAEKKEFTRRTGLPFPEAPKANVQGNRTGGAASPRTGARGTPQTGSIPEPPPEFITVGRGLQRPNPEYDRWERRYGAAYRAQAQ